MSAPARQLSRSVIGRQSRLYREAWAIQAAAAAADSSFMTSDMPERFEGPADVPTRTDRTHL